MPTPTRCYRHHTHTWIAGCTDCTAWHLHRHLAARTPAPAAPLTLVPRTPTPARTLRAVA